MGLAEVTSDAASRARGDFSKFLTESVLTTFSSNPRGTTGYGITTYVKWKNG